MGRLLLVLALLASPAAAFQECNPNLVSSLTARAHLTFPTAGMCTWDVAVNSALLGIDQRAAFLDINSTWSGEQTFGNVGMQALRVNGVLVIIDTTGAQIGFFTEAGSFVMGQGSADAIIGGTRPALLPTTSNGAAGFDSIHVVGQTGQTTTGSTGQVAGDGGSATIEAGQGGAAVSGSTNGNGGNVTLTPGRPGLGAGTAGGSGSVRIRDAENNIRVQCTSTGCGFGTTTLPARILSNRKRTATIDFASIGGAQCQQSSAISGYTGGADEPVSGDAVVLSVPAAATNQLESVFTATFTAGQQVVVTHCCHRFPVDACTGAGTPSACCTGSKTGCQCDPGSGAFIAMVFHYGN